MDTHPGTRAGLKVRYIHSVQRAGGAPLLLPNSAEDECIRAAVASAGALVLTGGCDVAPGFYGGRPHPTVKEVDPVRDATEAVAIAQARQRDLPILAICRGIQMLNVALGGTLIQDIPSGPAGPALNHRGPNHAIRVKPGSLLAELWAREDLTVNSRHHQAIDRLAPALKATAWAPDGIIEAAESDDGYPLLALQCHPEDLSEAPEFLAPFQWLVAESMKRR